MSHPIMRIRFTTRLVIGLAIFYLIAEADCATTSNPKKDVNPKTEEAPADLNRRIPPVQIVRKAQEDIKESQNDTVSKNVDEAIPISTFVIAKQPASVTRYALSIKQVIECPSGKVLAGDGSCRPEA